MFSQISAYFAYAAFNTSNNQPYLDTYITFLPKNYKLKKADKGFQFSANIKVKIWKDSLLVAAKKYNLNSPVFIDSANATSFLDYQRFSLPNGKYNLEFEIYDNNNSKPKHETVVSLVEINFNKDSLQLSDVQLLESYKKSESLALNTKAGCDIIPYCVNYFSDEMNQLTFYIESYNAAKLLGESKHFIYTYFIETERGNERLDNFAGFKKQATAPVNCLIGKLNINNLGTGNYNLVVEIRDEKNVIRGKKKLFFQRENKRLDITYIQKKAEQNEIQNYFGACSNLDTLKMYVECLWPIADGIDKERIINQSIKKDADIMKKFVIDFWYRRAGDSVNPINLWSKYYRSVQQAMALFKCGKMPGYYTDRGRVYLQYGAPSQRAQQPNEANAYPYEIWQYYRTTDATNGQFFSNRKFVFVSKNLADDCYQLIHSDMRGELNNPRWQFELTRRNNSGIANPDNNTPQGTETNHFNDIYNNPR